MKAFFHRLHIGGGTKDRDRDIAKEKFPPLPNWPPQDHPRTNSTSTPTSISTFKPLPELVPSQFVSQLTPRSSPPVEPFIPLPPDTQSTTNLVAPNFHSIPFQAEEFSQDTPANLSDSTGRSSRKNASTAANVNTPSDVQKKVAFLSPPPTPANLDRALPDAPGNGTSPPSSAPLKTTVTRFQAVYGKEPRGSVSSGASSSKIDVTTPNKTTARATSTRTGSPYLQRSFEAASAPSLRSGTPYSSMSNNFSGSHILAAQSWSEVTEDDLVSNIGSRERTRQEVLFEIISSEERYVQELVKMKDTFIDPLLHPYSMTMAAASTPNLDYDYFRDDSPYESLDDLPPIAARFMSPTPSIPATPSKDTPNIDGESLETDEEEEAADRAGDLYDPSRRPSTSPAHPRSPYRIAARLSGRPAVSVPFPSRSHQSLPPTPRNHLSASTHSLGRQSVLAERDRERKHSQGNSTPKGGILRKFKKSQTTTDGVLGNAIAPHQLPEALRVCLEVIDTGVFDGHKKLSEALKKRYDDQYPLVRSLADVFVSNSDIFQGYATYVLHLERALEQVDAALSNHSTTKKPKNQDAGEWQKVCKFLQKLEENACDKGETGLAITLSKPFQRLLKYPLLFQNLLFHTDPSTFEYESTLQMVAEVENIVRSIEDEKIQKEERDKTRDVFARIEGLDKVRQLALPKPTRVLVEERSCAGFNSPLNTPKPSSPPPVVNAKGVRGKSSFKRLSDVLTASGINGKKDLWFVIFNDVVLQCQRTGTTCLPLVAATNSRTTSLPEFQGKSKYTTTGRRSAATKPRNLYKFIKIETWTIGDVVQPRQGVVSMEDVAKSRSQALSSQPRIVPLPDDEEKDDGDSDDSDKKSKMSFSYWGADKVTVQKPVLKGRPGSGPRKGVVVASYGRESSANAKFGSRLVSDGSLHNPRPSSRRQVTTPVSRRQPPSEDGINYAKSTVTRPAWDTSTRTPLPPTKRSRNASQASAAATRTPVPASKSPVSSPSPSEDSGVGLYRQMLANDPSFNGSA